MESPEGVISLSELRRSTGERGTRMYVAFKGLVYDVTDCPHWKSGVHEREHFPPHREDVFKRPGVTLVGRLES
jgi:predicted heme/steroid binding protein